MQIIKTAGVTQLRDRITEIRSRSNIDHYAQRMLDRYDEFYEAAGGCLCLITRKKGETDYGLSVVVQRGVQFPSQPRRFESVEKAWEFVIAYARKEL